MIIQTERTLFKKDENADAVKAADSLIAKAAASGASDIHIEPGENNACVRMRIDGVLYKEAEMNKTLMQAVVSRVKVLAGMDIAEKRLPRRRMAALSWSLTDAILICAYLRCRLF